MNLVALATDYDGTMAYDGEVRESTICAMEKLRDSGRKLVLVTGRQLEELLNVFPRPDLFDWIVVENGGVLYCPRTQESRLLGEAVPPALPDALRERGVENVGVGRSVVAAWRPHECTVLEVLRELGLDRQIIFNKEAVMVLPTGVNKASGLAAALQEMKISPHNVVAIGDAENDLPMLTQCQWGVAVANALEAVKTRADLVTKADHGAGVEELICSLLKGDLESRLSTDGRHGLVLGTAKTEPKRTVWLPGLGQTVLVAGPSGSGKSTSVIGLLERLANAAYQLCIFDPEGDYEAFEPAITLGNPHYVPTADEVLSLLERMHSVTVNLLGVSVDARPHVASELLRKMEDLRAGKGRPHWFVVDEAHHIFPSDASDESTALPQPPKGSLTITVHPGHIRKQALESVDIVIVVDKDPQQTVRDFCRSAGVEEPELQQTMLERGEVLVWFRREPNAPFVVAAEPGKNRTQASYAEVR